MRTHLSARARLARIIAVAGVALVGALTATAISRAGTFTFTADPGSGPLGTAIHLQSTAPCAGGRDVFVTVQMPGGPTVDGFNEAAFPDANGNWAGTFTTLIQPIPTGAYEFVAHCDTDNGTIAYDPVPFTWVRETFTANPGSGPFGIAVHLQSTAPCPGGRDIFVSVQVPGGPTVAGFDEAAFPDANGNWAGTFTHLNRPIPTGSYELVAHCDTDNGTIAYDPVPFTWVPETFTADPGSGPLGTAIQLRSTAPCIGGRDVFVTVQMPGGPTVDGFNEAAFPDANGNWAGTFTTLIQPISTGSYELVAHCDTDSGPIAYDPVPFTYTAADSAPPTVTIASGVPDGQNGWFVTGPVTGTVSADDAASGGSNIASIACGALPLITSGIGTPHATGSFSIGSQGLTHISCTATDSAGNSSGPATADVKLDSVAPSLAPSVTPTPVLLRGSASATPNAADSTSGLASQSCGAVDTSSAGLHTVGCTATDNAGNVANASLGYLVGYQILGFFSPAPKSKWKAGQTVPVKLALADANGTRIPDAEAQALLSPNCRVTFSATGAQSATGCMKYDAGEHQFLFNLKLGQATGTVAIAVAVAYPGTPATTYLSSSITVTS